jgi:hypothetical protein
VETATQLVMHGRVLGRLAGGPGGSGRWNESVCGLTVVARARRTASAQVGLPPMALNTSFTRFHSYRTNLMTFRIGLSVIQSLTKVQLMVSTNAFEFHNLKDV